MTALLLPNARSELCPSRSLSCWVNGGGCSIGDGKPLWRVLRTPLAGILPKKSSSKEVNSLFLGVHVLSIFRALFFRSCTKSQACPEFSQGQRRFIRGMRRCGVVDMRLAAAHDVAYGEISTPIIGRVVVLSSLAAYMGEILGIVEYPSKLWLSRSTYLPCDTVFFLSPTHY